MIKAKHLFPLLALLLLAGCVSKKVEQPHPPPLMIARNSEGVVTMQWETQPGWYYTIFYQDNPTSDWRVLPGANRLRGTGQPLNAKDRVDPKKPPRRYRVLPEKK